MTSNFAERRRQNHTDRRRRGQNLDAITDEIEQLVGLDAVKDEIANLIDLAQIFALKKERDIPVTNHSFHMVFSGPPGTGKTTVARLIGKIFYELNLLRKDTMREVTKADLVASYQGQTLEKVTDVVNSALDGVLFVDEAYMLAGGGGATGHTDSFSQEAIDTLLKLMEDHRDRLVCIFAGYTDEMRRFEEANPGLKSRISTRLRFESYGEDQLFSIFLGMVEKHRMTLSADAREEARKYVSDLARIGAKDPSFGNAREIRRMFEALQPIQASRLAREHSGGGGIQTISDEQLLGLELDDIVELAARH